MINRYHDLKGEQKDQLLVVCDKKGNPIGQETRKKCHTGKGKTHLAFVGFVIDGNNNMILTKRSRKKSLWGGYWDASVVSHVLPGERVEEAGRRRGIEELGIEVEFRKIEAFHYVAQCASGVENEYCFVMVGRLRDDIHANPVEISEVKKATFSEVKNLAAKNPGKFTPWLKIALTKIRLKISL